MRRSRSWREELDMERPEHPVQVRIREQIEEEARERVRTRYVPLTLIEHEREVQILEYAELHKSRHRNDAVDAIREMEERASAQALAFYMEEEK